MRNLSVEMDRKIEAEKDARRQRTAEEILDALKASGMSRKEFALKMGRQPSEVTKRLSGRHNFTLDLLAEISVVLSCPISGAKDITVPMQSVDGYGVKDSAHCLQDSNCMIENIDLPQTTISALIDKAGKAGMSLREYVRTLLAEKAAEKSVSAYDFCGIWPHDAPDVEEIRSLRMHNTLKEL